MQTTLMPQKQMQFAPVPNDDDELTQAIEDDSVNHDDSWTLKDELDAAALDNFLDEALAEIGPAEPEEQA